MKVLISDVLGEDGIKILKKEKGITLDIKTGLHPEELKEIIGEYDALIIRSATKVTEDLLDCATKLKVVGRAGIGLDNVDIPAATRKGIAVMNTPGGNTITTAEHAIAMIMSLTRNIPQATSSMKQNLWEKKKLQGKEVFQKKLGIIGFGNIGSIVADRARGLKMEVLVFDPNLSPETIEKAGYTIATLDELYENADYITVHVPKIKVTTKMLNKEAFSKMKDGVMIINCARGGIVDEKDLYDAIKSGKVAGAALDVFETEPPKDSPLLKLPNVISTPHLGASTAEAQSNVAIAVADQIIKYLKENTIINAVNVSSVTGETLKKLKPFLFLADKIGILQSELNKGVIRKVEMEYTGNFLEEDDTKAITTSFLKGLLTPIVKDSVNFVNAPSIVERMGIKVISGKAIKADYINLISTKVFTDNAVSIISGTIFGKNISRIIRVNNFRLEIVPHGHLMFIENNDKPGVVGAVGTILGKRKINIARMTVGREIGGTNSVIFIKTDKLVSDEIIEELGKIKNVLSATALDLGDGIKEDGDGL